MAVSGEAGDSGEERRPEEITEEKTADQEEEQAGERNRDEGNREGSNVAQPPPPPEGGMRRPRFRPCQPTPLAAEVEAHNRTHVPYRSWCPHCVRGRGRADAHRRGAGRGDGYEHPHLAIDYGFVGNEESRTGAKPVLIGMEAKYSLSVAMVVPAKGNAEPWIAKRLAGWLDRLGSKKCTIKTDGENAMVALVREVKANREDGTETIHELAVKGEKQTNHVAEGGVAIVKGLMRTFVAALEGRYGEQIEGNHPIVPWLVEHATNVRNRYQVGDDGKTPMERWRGRKISSPICEFGERIWWMPLKKKASDRPTFRTGVYLGCTPAEGLNVVGTPQGVFVCRSVRTMTEENRWNGEAARMIKGTPWSPRGEEDQERTNAGVGFDLPPAEEEETRETAPTAVPRRMKIETWMLREHGYTRSCPGCRATNRGRSRTASTTRKRAGGE